MLEVFGDRNIVIGRELTKKFEEFIRGTISEVIEVSDSLKGEMIVLVEGFKEEKSLSNPFLEIEKLIGLNYKPKEAIKEVASMFNLNKQDLYKEYIAYKDTKKD